MNNTNRNETKIRSEALVLTVHGFGSKKLYMAPLCSRLRNRGFRVENWGYSSVFGDVRASATRLAMLLNAKSVSEQRIHIVAHSMGSLIVRSALSQMDPIARRSIGYTVLLAPPNGGAPIASALAPILSWLVPPLHELSTARTSLVNSIPKNTCVPTGIIAAKWDVLVPRSSTVLEDATDYVLFEATHNSLLISKRTADAVECFLTNKSFRTSITASVS